MYNRRCQDGRCSTPPLLKEGLAAFIEERLPRFSNRQEKNKMIVDIQIPPIIKIGGGSFLEAPAILTRLNCARPLIVTDAFFVSQGLPGKLQDQIVQSGLECAIFSDTVPDPTTDAVDAGVRAFVEGNHDSLVSLGGGSPIDTAKAIGMLVANGGDARDYKVPNPIPKAGPPHIAIPPLPAPARKSLASR